MKIIYLLLSWQFLLFETVQSNPTSNNPDGSSKLPDVVNFNVLSIDTQEETHVTLVPTESFLANENVPVWKTSLSNLASGIGVKLKSLKGVMKELGPFTVYRDPATCATALYFHKQKQFEGVIGHQYFIRKLVYNPITKQVEPTAGTVFQSPLEKHPYKVGENLDPIIREPEDDPRIWIPSRRKFPDTVYVETLVMVNYDIARDLKHDYVAIVTYVLNFFNAVDMLYSKIQEPHIKINIAGIIIGTAEWSFPRFIDTDCYEQVHTTSNEEISVLNEVRAFKAIRQTLGDYPISPESYDIVVFLTRSRLRPHGPDYRSPLGVATFQLDPDDYSHSLKKKGITIVSDITNLQRFPTAAHELAHLFGALHDGGPLWEDDGMCSANLMRKMTSLCNRCLTFGGTTLEYLKNFFGSRLGCIFHNKPQSLNNPAGPRAFWKPRDQCECYGFKSNLRPKQCFPLSHVFMPSVDCASFLKCIDENGRVHDTDFHMDGTPCAKNRVCWNKECKPVLKDHE